MVSTRKKAFTLIELLVVIAIIALLLSIVMPALGRAKVYAQRIICSNHLKQQSLGTILYSNENDSYVPTSGLGPWLWDTSFWMTNELSRYAGFTENDTYFCPANKTKVADDARFWQYSWVASGGPYPNPVTLRDESTLTAAQQKQYYRVLPYIYMFDKYDSTTGASILNKTLVSGEKANWIRKLSDVKAAGAKTMIMDVIISEQNNWNFFNITSGGIVALSGNTLVDSSNHPSRQRLYSGANQGVKPEGSNIAYADGHVAWQDFGPQPPNSNIKHQYTQGQWFWW